MIGDVAAAIGGVKGDPGAVENVLAGQQVLHVPVAPERDDVRVLEQQQMVRRFSEFARRDELPLRFQRLAVSDAPELAQAALTH